jgi:hypothetical protein
VIVGFGCGGHLERTLGAWERARQRAGTAAETVVVLPRGDAAAEDVARLAPAVRVVEVAVGECATPGANRNRGAAGAAAEFLLFVDGDVELDAAFVARALDFLDERHWRDGREVGRVRDLFGIGAGGDVAYLAPAWICRREAFERAGGFDPRLPSDEDFELGLRLRQGGWTLHAEAALAGTHHCTPRPSFVEIARRWRSGMYAGPGLALRHAWGGPRFGALLAREWLNLTTFAFALLGAGAAGLALAGRAGPLVIWLAAALLAWAGHAVRKRSPRLAAFSLLIWGLQGAAILAAWLSGAGAGGAPAAAGPRRRE